MSDNNLARDKKEARTILNSYLIYKNRAEIKALEIEEVKNNYDVTKMVIVEKTG